MANRILGGILGGLGKGVYANAEEAGRMQDARSLLEMKMEFEQKRDDMAAAKRAGAAKNISDIYSKATSAQEVERTSPNMADLSGGDVTWKEEKTPSQGEALKSITTNPEFWASAADAPEAAKGILGMAAESAKEEKEQTEKSAVMSVFQKLRGEYGDEKAAAYANAIVSKKLDPGAFKIDIKDVGGTIYVDGKPTGLTESQKEKNARLGVDLGDKTAKKTAESVDRILKSFQSTKGTQGYNGKFEEYPISPMYRDVVERAIQMNKTSEGAVLNGLENLNKAGGKYEFKTAPSGVTYTLLPGTDIIVNVAKPKEKQGETKEKRREVAGANNEQGTREKVAMPPGKWDKRGWEK